MLRLSWLAPLLLLSGCAYTPPKVTVYGTTGKQYIAPDLCAAIVQCKNAAESACYYDTTIWTSATGDRETSACKQAK
jgi:hypothetical protein